MWWALAAAAIPYVMQASQGQPQQPNAPPITTPTNNSAYSNQLLNNAFNPNTSLFSNASATVEENVNRALAKQGLIGSSAGGALQANTQGVLAQKWLEDQTSRQRMALNAADQGTIGYTNAANEAANQGYQYGAAAYNRNNAWNSSQVAGLSGLAGAAANAYGQSQTQNTLNANSAAYQSLMAQMQQYYGGGQAPAPGGMAGDSSYQNPMADLYANYVPQYTPGMQSIQPGY